MNVGTIAIALALCIVATDGSAALMSTNDVWDVRNGATVTADSGVKSTSASVNMFGGENGTVEVGNTVFPDDYLKGHTHWVEWQTPNAVVITNINLVAAHDGDGGRDANERGFSTFSFYIWNTGAWVKAYQYSPSNPYGGGSNYTQYSQLELTANLTNVTAKKFRAEFVQFGDRTSSARGPRILELDGYGYPLVLPQPLILQFSNCANRQIATTSHPAAVYDLQRNDSLDNATWTNVLGASSIRGQSMATWLTDTNLPAKTSLFYRVRQTISP